MLFFLPREGCYQSPKGRVVKMAMVQFNDRLRSRSLQHLNLLIAKVGDQQVIFEFTGKSIPGVVVVRDRSYKKDGKWSYNMWECEMAPGVHGFPWAQDWETGAYLSPSWDATLARLQEAAYGQDCLLDRAAVERFIRSKFTSEKEQAAVRVMDDAEGMLERPSGDILKDLLSAQEDLARAQQELRAIKDELNAMEQAEQARAMAEATLTRAAKARAAMARGCGLAELRELLG